MRVHRGRQRAHVSGELVRQEEILGRRLDIPVPLEAALQHNVQALSYGVVQQLTLGIYFL